MIWCTCGGGEKRVLFPSLHLNCQTLPLRPFSVHLAYLLLYPSFHQKLPLPTSFEAEAIVPFISPTSRGSRPTDLILRVSGHHLPKTKTENEAVIISWISQNTTIPIASVVYCYASCIEHEFIILERAIGQSLDPVYHSLNEKQISDLVDKLVEIYAQLHSKKWSQIGGLKVDDQRIIVPGPVLEETFWQFPDIGARTNPPSLWI